ncbi:MAG TPA: cupin domain-containing protein [Gaiellaceae bacterium]|nr:cupin domain-containing protein [Gaiellaceae bacterium]
MEWLLHAGDAVDGRLFDVGTFTQRLVDLRDAGGGHDADEILYVLEGNGSLDIAGERHALRPGISVFAGAGTTWSADGGARAVSVLVHDPDASTACAVVDMDAVAKGTATAGREFVLGATPAVGCMSATQFIGLIPPGRAPDHFHRYEEVIYVLEGEGRLEIGGESEPIGPGSCIHLPRTLVHALANTGKSELRVLGVFRPAGSPAEAYYPDGTLATVPDS